MYVADTKRICVCVLNKVELGDICDDFFFQAEDGIRDLVRSRGLGDVYKRQVIRAGNKDIIIVFSGGDKKFYRIFYENNTFGHKEIGGYIQTKQTNSIVNKDLDDDGVEELISDQYFNQLTLLKYDTLLDTLTSVSYTHLTLPTSGLV